MPQGNAPSDHGLRMSAFSDRAAKAAAVLRDIADRSAESMGERQADMDAHADIAEVVAHLADLADPAPPPTAR